MSEKVNIPPPIGFYIIAEIIIDLSILIILY